jgi:hypothetical protein
MGTYVASGPTPNFRGAIGVTDNSVEGTDIITPALSWSETHTYALAAITDSYLDTVYRLSGKVNSAPFRLRPNSTTMLAVGEVLYEGAEITLQPETIEITHQFSFSPNATNLQNGPILVLSKRGWDYMWTRYVDKVVDGLMIKLPVAAVVDRVYPYSNLNALGI